MYVIMMSLKKLKIRNYLTTFAHNPPVFLKFIFNIEYDHFILIPNLIQFFPF